MASRRRLARIAVLQTLFELDFERMETEGDAQTLLARNAAELGGEELVDLPYAHALLEQTLEFGDAIRETVQKHAPEWPLERMDRISRCILSFSTCELLRLENTPKAVVMDEAIEIAKEYGGEESPKFVNGVLNAIAHAP